LGTPTAFISGYDPSYVFVEGQPLTQTDNRGACSIDITSMGDTFSDWSGWLSCSLADGSSFDYQQDGAYWHTNINNFGSFLGELGIWETTPEWLQGLDISLTGEESNGLKGFSLDFDSNAYNVNLLYHGQGLGVLLEKTLPFEAGFGREYNLAADNQYYPGGQMEFIDYKVKMRTWPSPLEEYNIPFMLTNCYAYSTYTSPFICIDPQPLSDRRKACTPRDISLTSQGAPVAVTKIEQQSSGKKANFKITIKNVGNGEIIYWGDVSRCSPYSPLKLTEKNKNIVQLFSVRIEDTELKCTPTDDKIKLVNGEGTISCTYDLKYNNIQTAYQTPLIIEFWYGYMETESQYVLFKKVI